MAWGFKGKGCENRRSDAAPGNVDCRSTRAILCRSGCVRIHVVGPFREGEMRRFSVIVLVGLALGVAAAATGCGTPAQAEPLDVTYYYLPG